MAHGVSASVAFALRRERHPERVWALLELSANSYGLMYISLLVILVSGVIVTFLGGFWNRGWIWASLILLIAISAAMGALGGRFTVKHARRPACHTMIVVKPFPPSPRVARKKWKLCWRRPTLFCWPSSVWVACW